MKKHLSSIVMGVILLIGISLLLYPTVSNALNQHNESRAIASYNNSVSHLSKTDYSKMLQDAEAYNAALLNGNGNHFSDGTDQNTVYQNLLNPSGIGVMGSIEIPSIGVSLPIYHGTDETILQIGVGHLSGTSLPVGGKGTHAVLSGHRGLPSAKLFTDLDQLEVGDTFTIKVLDQVLTYQVDQIKTVLPEETQDLAIDPDKDYVTLVTCTPYAINTHRLLVRGVRIPTPEKTEAKSAETGKNEKKHLSPLTISTMVAEAVIAVLLVLILISFFRGIFGKKKRKEQSSLKDQQIPDGNDHSDNGKDKG